MIEIHSGISQTNGMDADVISKTTETASDLAKAAMMTTGDGSAAITMGLCAAFGTLQPVTNIVGNAFGVGGKEGDCEVDIDKTMTHQSLLFSAMLLTVALVKRPQGHEQAFESGIGFGPHIVRMAMELYEKTVGEKPDAYLNPLLVKLGREASITTSVSDHLKGTGEIHADYHRRHLN